jgi:hypothetical protein
VRGEAAPKQTKQGFELYTVAQKFWSHPSEPTKETSLSFFAPHTTPNLCPKQITSTKKLVTESQH